MTQQLSNKHSTSTLTWLWDLWGHNVRDVGYLDRLYFNQYSKRVQSDVD